MVVGDGLGDWIGGGSWELFWRPSVGGAPAGTAVGRNWGGVSGPMGGVD